MSEQDRNRGIPPFDTNGRFHVRKIARRAATVRLGVMKTLRHAMSGLLDTLTANTTARTTVTGIKASQQD